MNCDHANQIVLAQLIQIYGVRLDLIEGVFLVAQSHLLHKFAILAISSSKTFVLPLIVFIHNKAGVSYNVDEVSWMLTIVSFCCLACELFRYCSQLSFASMVSAWLGPCHQHYGSTAIMINRYLKLLPGSTFRFSIPSQTLMLKSETCSSSNHSNSYKYRPSLKLQLPSKQALIRELESRTIC